MSCKHYEQAEITTVRNGVPESIIPDANELFDAARRVLDGQHTTLWGQSFNIIDEMDTAAEWLAGYVDLVLREAWWPRRKSNV